MGAIGIQCIVTLIVSALLFMGGVAIVWPSYALRMLEGADSALGYKIKKEEANLVGSMAMLGSLTACIFVGYIAEMIGRKRTEILSGLSFVLAWAIIATSKSAIHIVMGRFIIGFAGGTQLVMGYIFLSEISQTSLRGTLMSILTFSFNLGNLISYIEGWICSYEMINYINLTLAVVVILFLCFLKETPAYLIRHGKEKEALHSLKFYRGAKTITPEILQEFEYIRNLQKANDSCNGSVPNDDDESTQEKVKLNDSNQDTDKNLKQNPWKLLYTSKPLQRMIITLTLVSVLSILMGMMAVLTYAGQFFQRATPDLSPDMCSVIMAIILAIAGAVSVVVTDLIPRRTLMMGTCAGSAVCMVLLTSMLHWPWAPDWGIPLMIISYSVFFQIGPANVPYVQIAECIPSQLKSLGSPLIIGSMITSNFLILYLFEPAIAIFGLDGIFLFFSIMSILTVIATYLFMRETKKEPSENIQIMFEQGYIYRNPKI